MANKNIFNKETINDFKDNSITLLNQNNILHWLQDKKIVNKTTDYTVLSTDCNKNYVFSNIANPNSTITFTLPSGVEGNKLEFFNSQPNCSFYLDSGSTKFFNPYLESIANNFKFKINTFDYIVLYFINGIWYSVIEKIVPNFYYTFIKESYSDFSTDSICLLNQNNILHWLQDKKIVNKTTDYTVLSTDCNKNYVFSNIANTNSSITFTLPSGVEGNKLEFFNAMFGTTFIITTGTNIIYDITGDIFTSSITLSYMKYIVLYYINGNWFTLI